MRNRTRRSRPVQRPHHVQQRSAQVGERQAVVDGEPFELVEDREVGRVDRVPPVHAADRDHVDRRLALLHDVDLRGRRLRAQQALPVEEERVARRARRMPLRKGELVEVELDRLDLSIVSHLVAEPEEGVLDGPPDLRDQVELAERRRLTGERDVEVDVLDDVRAELALALLQRLLDRRPRRVQRHAGLAVAHLAQRQLQRALPAQVADAQLLEPVGVRGRGDRGPCFALERRGVHRATIPSAS